MYVLFSVKWMFLIRMSLKKPHTYKEESMVCVVSFVLHSRFIVFTFDSLYNKNAIILR